MPNAGTSLPPFAHRVVQDSLSPTNLTKLIGVITRGTTEAYFQTNALTHKMNLFRDAAAVGVKFEISARVDQLPKTKGDLYLEWKRSSSNGKVEHRSNLSYSHLSDWSRKQICWRFCDLGRKVAI